MPPAEFVCPDCRTRLRFPARPTADRFSCPQCGASFPNLFANSEPPPRVPTPPRPPTPPPSPPPPVPVDQLDPIGYEDLVESRPRRRRRRRRSGPPVSLALVLIAFGLLILALVLGGGTWWLFSANGPLSDLHFRPPSRPKGGIVE